MKSGEINSEALVVIQVKSNGGLNLCGTSGSEKKWSDSINSLKVVSTRFVHGLNMRCVRK